MLKTNVLIFSDVATLHGCCKGFATFNLLIVSKKSAYVAMLHGFQEFIYLLYLKLQCCRVERYTFFNIYIYKDISRNIATFREIHKNVRKNRNLATSRVKQLIINTLKVAWACNIVQHLFVYILEIQ